MKVSGSLKEWFVRDIMTVKSSREGKKPQNKKQKDITEIPL